MPLHPAVLANSADSAAAMASLAAFHAANAMARNDAEDAIFWQRRAASWGRRAAIYRLRLLHGVGFNAAERMI